MALVESLGSLGYGARGFASAEEFVANVGEASCDCVITDIHMAGMSGFDLKRLLVSHESKVPVIMITAHAEAGLQTRAASAGAVCLLRKPLDTGALVGCLDKALNEHLRTK
jgi:FixJ family two-component response regulator